MLFDRYLPIIGGAETQGAALSQQLIQRGYPVHIVTRRVRPELPAHETLHNIPVDRLAPIGLSKRANALMLFRMFFYLMWHARQYDVFHVHCIGPLGIAALVAGKLTRKVVILRLTTAGDIERRDHGMGATTYTRLLRRFLLPPALWRAILRQASAFVALTDEMLVETNANQLGHLTHKIANGVDTARYCPLDAAAKHEQRRALNLPPDAPILMTSGRLVQSKRLDVLIDAFAAIHAEYPQAVLLVAGSGALQIGGVEDDLKAQAQRLGVAEQVRFLGNVPNVEAYLQASDVFVFPSAHEGMPNALLEALACGLPALASRIGGVVDVMDESMGWLLPVGDVPAFTAALRTCLSQPELARAKGEAAAAHVQARFSLDAMGSAYEALYARLLGKSNA